MICIFFGLNITSQAVSANIGLNSKSDKASNKVSANVFSGSTKYELKTFVEQAGISAGEDGVNIKVKGKTILTGAIIDSKADKEKNQIITGDLELNNITNFAKESDKGMGIG